MVLTAATSPDDVPDPTNKRIGGVVEVVVMAALLAATSMTEGAAFCCVADQLGVPHPVRTAKVTVKASVIRARRLWAGVEKQKCMSDSKEVWRPWMGGSREILGFLLSVSFGSCYSSLADRSRSERDDVWACEDSTYARSER